MPAKIYSDRLQEKPNEGVTIVHIIFTHGILLDDHFLNLLDHLVNPDFNFFLGIIFALKFVIALFPNFLHAKRAPSVPFVDQSFAESDELSTDIALLCGVLFVKRTTIFSEISANLLLFFLRQKCNRSWSPNKLFESVLNVFDKFLASEIPDCISIFEL